MRHMVRPMGIVENLAADGDQVGRPGRHKIFGHIRIQHQPDDHGRNARLVANPRPIWPPEALIARPHGRGREARDTARGTIDDIDAARLQLPRQCDGIIELPALLAAIRIDSGDTHEQGLVVRPDRANLLGRFQGEAHAAGQITAIGIVAMVRKRRQK